MAKSEVPSIIVRPGSSTGNGACSSASTNSTNGIAGQVGEMEGHEQCPQPQRQLARMSRLSKQEEFDLEEESSFAPSPVTIHIQDDTTNNVETELTQQNDVDGAQVEPTISEVNDQLSPDGSCKAEGTARSKVSGSRHLLGNQGSSQGSLEGSSPSLSRDSSTETYTDSTGIDLQQFIVDTLHKSQKDRMMLVKIEQDLITLVKDTKCQSFKFSAMSSYNRMLVHRVAAFFGLEHNVDKSGASVIVNKTKNTRIPDLKFQDHIRDELVPDEPKKLILKRDSASFEEGKEFLSPTMQEGYGESPYSRSHDGTLSSSRRSSQEDLRWVGEPRPWSSTDSDSSGRKGEGGSFDGEGTAKPPPGSSRAASNCLSKPVHHIGSSKSDSETKDSLNLSLGARPAVTKASSFGGISVLTRENPKSAKNIKLTKSESLNAPSVSRNGTIASSPSVAAPPPPAVAPNPSKPKPPVTETVQDIPKATEALVIPSQPNNSTNDSSQSVNCESEPVLPQPTCNESSAKTVPAPPTATVQLITQPQQTSVKAVNSNPPNGVSQQQSQNSLVPVLQTPPTQSHPQPHIQSIRHPQPNSAYRNNPMLYIPCVTSQVPSLLQQNTSPVVMNAGQMHHPGMHNSIFMNPQQQEHRQYTQDGPNELASQMSTLSFAPHHHHHQQQQHHMGPPPSPGMEYKIPSAGSQPFFVPSSDKGLSSYPGQQQQQQPAQVQPLYYIQHLGPNMATMQTMRYVCPAQPMTAIKTNEGRDSPAQTPSPHLSGHSYLPGYSLVTVAPNSDNVSYTTMPYFSYALPQSGGNSGPPTSNNSMQQQPQPLQPNNPGSLPIYPYGNVLLNGNSIMGAAGGGPPPPNSSHMAGPPHFGPRPMPVCLMTNGGGAPQPPHCAQLPPNPSANTYALTFRPHTPPNQQQQQQQHNLNSNNMQNNQHPPYMSYAFYSPPTMQRTEQGAGTPNNKQPPYVAQHQQQPLLHNPFVTFLKPSIPVMSNVRNSTPPPATLPQHHHSQQQHHPPTHHPTHHNQNSIPAQQQRRTTPPPPPQQQQSSTNQQHHPKANPYLYNINKNNQDNSNQAKSGASMKPRMPGPVHVGPPPIRLANSGTPMYRRGLPLLPGKPKNVRLLGHPLQQQMMNPVLFSPRGPSMPHYPPPHQQYPTSSASSAQMGGQANLTSRSPKPRKPRNKWNNNGAGPGPPNVGPTSGGPSGQAAAKNNVTTGTGYPDEGYNRGNILLAVEGLPDGLKCSEVERFLEQVTNQGAKIQISRLNSEGGGGVGGNGNNSNNSVDFVVNSSKYIVYALFESETAAQSALLNIKTPKFQLRPPSSLFNPPAPPTHHSHYHHHRGSYLPPQHRHHNAPQQQHHRNPHHKDGKSIS